MLTLLLTCGTVQAVLCVTCRRLVQNCCNIADLNLTGCRRITNVYACAFYCRDFDLDWQSLCCTLLFSLPCVGPHYVIVQSVCLSVCPIQAHGSRFLFTWFVVYFARDDARLGRLSQRSLREEREEPLWLLVWDFLQAWCPSCHPTYNSVKASKGFG